MSIYDLSAWTGMVKNEMNGVSDNILDEDDKPCDSAWIDACSIKPLRAVTYYIPTHLG